MKEATQTSSALNPSQDQRIAWIDVARGICILLVVFMHFDEMFYARFASWELAEKTWDTLSSAARPARIPAFFLISGILASRYINATWRKIFEKRILVQYYAFALWSLIHLVILFSLYRTFDFSVVIEITYRYIFNLIWPSTQIWFLWALAVFFVVAVFAQRFPRTALSVSLLLFLGAEYVDDTVGTQIMRSSLFFLFGCYFPLTATKLGDRKPVWFLLVLGFSYVLSILLIIIFGEYTVGIWLPATLIGVALVFQTSSWLSISPVVRPLSYIGRHALPIYVLHGVILLSLSAYAKAYEWGFNDTVLGRAGDLVLPVFGNFLLVGACLAIYVLIRRAGAVWMFQPSESLMRKFKSLPHHDTRLDKPNWMPREDSNLN